MKTSIENVEQKKLSDQVAGRLAHLILKYQELFTKMLSGKTNHWSLKQQWIFLCLICIVLGGAFSRCLQLNGRDGPLNKKNKKKGFEVRRLLSLNFQTKYHQISLMMMRVK